MAEEPKVHPFKYILIPADKSEEVKEVNFEGTEDAVFRDTIRNYFRSGPKMTMGQKEEYLKTLAEKSKANGGQGGSLQGVIDNVAAESTFEIVPIILPTVANGFIGTSLYIDDVGRFKDLPLNDRASKIGQRDIRGDAFLCANHDDPVADWERVDCSVEQYNALYANPVQSTLDTSNQAQMQAAGFMRDAQSVVVKPEEAAQALEAKDQGNKLFGAGDITGALEQYSTAIQLTTARRDLLENRAEVEAMRVAALSNRALCYNKVKKFKEAQADCQVILSTPGCEALPKVLFRLAQAFEGQQEFDSALSALDNCEAAKGPEEDIKNMRASIQQRKTELQQQQKKAFSKMFA